MQRELKFRAWIEGKFITVFPGHSISCDDVKKGEPGGFDLEPEIPLMQYTGLKDKNGKEIYEGDIVKHEATVEGCSFHNQITHVVWNNEEACFSYALCHYDWEGMHYPKEWEVIGNIHQNPDLLPK